MATVNTLQQLNVQSFPPGTPPAFKDWLLRLGVFSQGTGETANNAEGAASDAFQIADQQRIRNDQQDGEISSLNGRMNTIEVDFNTLQGNFDTLETAVNDLEADVIKKSLTTLQVMQGPLSVGTELRVNNIKVMGGRNTGWTAATGTQQKGGFNSDATYADVAALNGGLVEIRQVVAALIAMGISQGFIGT